MFHQKSVGTINTQLIFAIGPLRNCRQATKRLLPKIYKVNPQTEALEQMNAHFEDIKRFMRDLQTENKQLRDTIVEMKKSTEVKIQTSALTTTEQLNTMTNDLQNQLAALKEGTNKQEKETNEMKNAINVLEKNQLETTTVTNQVLALLGQINKENTKQMTTLTNDLQNQLAALKEGTNKQEKETNEIKNVINVLEKNQLESGVAISGHVTMVTNQVLSRLGEIKTQNDKPFPDIKKDANKLEKDLLELNKSTKEQQTTVAVKMKSMSDQMEMLKQVTTKHGEESVAIKKAIAGVADEIPLLHRELQNQRETGATNEKLTTVKQQMISLLYRIEMQNKMQLEYMQTQSTDFSSFLRKNKYGETLPRDERKEVNSCDSLDTKFNWTISEIREKTGKCKIKDVFSISEEFSIPTHGLKFRAKLGRGTETLMGIQLNFTKNPSADSCPLFHSRKFALVDQSNGGGKKDVMMLDEPLFRQNSAEDMTRTYFWANYFFKMNLLRDSDKYVKNDEILIRIILEPIALMFKRVSSMDGTLLVRIDNFTERKREAVDGIKEFLTSESFYTSDKGHSMDLWIFLNDKSTNGEKGIAICPKFRIGEWDNSLSFPIKCKYTYVLMDQSDAQTKRDIRHESGVQEIQNYDDFSKYGNFTSHEVVEKLPYLKDDSLLIKFIVEIVKP